MPCCIPILEAFHNKTTSIVSYPDAMKAIYGQYPKVQVIYYDFEMSEYYVSNNFTRVTFTGSAIEVFHGGASTGFVKVY